MEAKSFKGCNATLAEDQPQYLNLKCHISDDGVVTSGWKMSLLERIKVLFTGMVYLQVLTFNRPLQPQKMLSSKPELED